MALTHINTVGIPAADPERALDFYTSTLGFELRLDAPFGGGMRWIEVAPAGASTTIALTPIGPSGAAGVDSGIRLATTDADADHQRLRAAGVDVDADVLRWEGVPPMFSFRDPDGNTLYVVQTG